MAASGGFARAQGDGVGNPQSARPAPREKKRPRCNPPGLSVPGPRVGVSTPGGPAGGGFPGALVPPPRRVFTFSSSSSSRSRGRGGRGGGAVPPPPPESPARRPPFRLQPAASLSLARRLASRARSKTRTASRPRPLGAASVAHWLVLLRWAWLLRKQLVSIGRQSWEGRG